MTFLYVWYNKHNILGTRDDFTMIGEIPRNAQKSTYLPPQSVIDFTKKVRQDYQIGWSILHEAHEELNNTSVIAEMNRNQKLFNSFVEDLSANPDESWRWSGTRPITRNKIISILAHMTAQITVPNIFAQNDQDEEDKQMANVMRDILTWMIQNSDYSQDFVLAVMGALVNPVTYMGAEFNEVMQSIKERLENGELTLSQTRDEVLSGFQTHIYSADQILITNAHERNIQKQRAIIKRTFVDFDTAEAMFGHHENFMFVQPGVKALFNEKDGLFYDIKEDTNTNLVEISRYYNRREDVGVAFVNGIYMGDSVFRQRFDENGEPAFEEGEPVSDELRPEDLNPIKHRDNSNRPKYNVAPIGYERINEHFFYFKSAVAKLAPEQDLVDAMYRMVMDGTFLSVMPPVAISGDDEVETDVWFPGAAHHISRDTEIAPLSSGNDLNAGYRALQEIERSMEQSSQSDIRSGQSQQGAQTAFEIARLEQNARIQLGNFGKEIGTFVAQIGQLMVDIALQHLTVAETEEILGGQVRLKYRPFLVADQDFGGEKITKHIRFSDELIGRKMTDEEMKRRRLKLLKESGAKIKDGKVKVERIINEVNPVLFSRMKYLVRVEPDSMLPKNEAFTKALKLEAYDRALQNPLIINDPEALTAVTRDFLFGALHETQGEEDKYLPKAKNILGRESAQNIRPDNQGSRLIEQATRQNALRGQTAEVA